jgi:hypothetical protein
MKRLLAAVAATLAIPAHAATVQWKSFDVQLAPRESHEECQRVEQGSERRYSWKANAAVDFNIHYHDATEAIYPVKREGMRADGGSFKPKLAQDYCWMWTARDKPARLDGKLELPATDSGSPKK